MSREKPNTGENAYDRFENIGGGRRGGYPRPSKEILSEEGYEVEVAADAGQARSSRAAQVPDLVLLDIWMPDTDGITLLREWSATDGYDCPVVMMSGSRHGGDRG